MGKLHLLVGWVREGLNHVDGYSLIFSYLKLQNYLVKNIRIKEQEYGCFYSKRSDKDELVCDVTFKSNFNMLVPCNDK